MLGWRRRGRYELLWRRGLCWLWRKAISGGTQNQKLESSLYASLLRRCGDEKALCEGRRVHAEIVERGHGRISRYVANLLIQMYGKCGALQDAFSVFNALPSPNVFSWTIIIHAFAQHAKPKQALHLFHHMQASGVSPNRVTFITLLSAFSTTSLLPEGRKLHSQIAHLGLLSDPVLANALLNMYRRCGSLTDTTRAFDIIIHHKDVFSFNTMIATYVEHGKLTQALQLFQQMQHAGVLPNAITFVSLLDGCACQKALIEGKRMHDHAVRLGLQLDIFVETALVNLYSKCGNLKDACAIFDSMRQRNVVSWNAMLTAYAQHGQGYEALQIFEQMQLENILPNKISFVSILSVCNYTGLLSQGCKFFVSMFQDHSIEPEEEHYNCMIDLLGRAGLLDEGEDLVSNMCVQPTVMSWTSLLGACKRHFKVEHGKQIAANVVELNAAIETPYVLLSNIYALAGKWDDRANTRKVIEDKCVKEEACCSSIERKEIHAELYSLSK